jgi:integrase
MSKLPTLKPVINRNNRKNKSGLYSIHIRVTLGRDTGYVSLDSEPRIAISDWNKKQTYKNYVKNTHPLSFEINQEIESVMSKIHKIVQRHYETSLTLGGLLKELKKNGDSNYFNDYVSEYIKNPAKKLDVVTLEKYKAFLLHLNNFRQKIKFSDLDSKLAYDFQRYLQNEKEIKGVKEKGLQGATIKSYFDKFKVVIKQARVDKFLTLEKTFSLFDYLDYKVEKPIRTFLEKEDIDKLIALKFTEKEVEMERDRDLFLFQIHTGYYYNDLQILKKRDITFQPNEGNMIVSERYKNKQIAIVPIFLFPINDRIIEKYRNIQEGEEILFDYTNFITGQKYNDKLKKIAKRAGIPEEISLKISNKVARHTFFQLLIRSGVSPAIAAKIAGHTDEKSTKSYYAVDLIEVIEGVRDIKHSLSRN